MCVHSPLPSFSHALHRFEYSLNGFSVFVNDEGTRTFLSLDVFSGSKEVRTISHGSIAGRHLVQLYALCLSINGKRCTHRLGIYSELLNS